jgi:ERCC4-type nuclease
LEKIKKGGYENTKTYYQKEFKADYIDDPQMKFLMTLPKCGEKTARAILEKF